jgi:putative hemolysin
MILNLLVALAGLVLLSAFFALFETAFFSLSRARLKQIAKTRPQGEIEVLARMLSRPQDLLTLVVLSITLVHISVGVVGALLLHEIVGARLGQGAFLLVESLGVTFLLLVFGEMAPKLFALAHAETLALMLALPMSWAARLLSPVTRPLGRALSLDSFFESHGGDRVTVEELKTIVEAGGREGALEPEERQLLQGAIRIGEITAGEIMLHREDMVAVEVGADASEVIEIVRETWHSRIPVYQGTLLNVVGIVHAKELLPYLEGGAGALTIRELVREATYVPAAQPIDEVLRELQLQRSQIAIVTDPAGQALGLVTLEDVLEELVGDLAVEYSGETAAVELQENGDAVVQGRVHVRDLNRILSVELPLERGRTVAELMRHLIPGPPVEGESVLIGGVDLILDSVIGGQVRGVRVVRVR